MYSGSNLSEVNNISRETELALLPHKTHDIKKMMVFTWPLSPKYHKKKWGVEKIFFWYKKKSLHKEFLEENYWRRNKRKISVATRELKVALLWTLSVGKDSQKNKTTSVLSLSFPRAPNQIEMLLPFSFTGVEKDLFVVLWQSHSIYYFLV